MVGIAAFVSENGSDESIFSGRPLPTLTPRDKAGNKVHATACVTQRMTYVRTVASCDVVVDSTGAVAPGRPVLCSGTGSTATVQYCTYGTCPCCP